MKSLTKPPPLVASIFHERWSSRSPGSWVSQLKQPTAVRNRPPNAALLKFALPLITHKTSLAKSTTTRRMLYRYGTTIQSGYQGERMKQPQSRSPPQSRWQQASRVEQPSERPFKRLKPRRGKQRTDNSFRGSQVDEAAQPESPYLSGRAAEAAAGLCG